MLHCGALCRRHTNGGQQQVRQHALLADARVLIAEPTIRVRARNALLDGRGVVVLVHASRAPRHIALLAERLAVKAFALDAVVVPAERRVALRIAQALVEVGGWRYALLAKWRGATQAVWRAVRAVIDVRDSLVAVACSDAFPGGPSLILIEEGDRAGVDAVDVVGCYVVLAAALKALATGTGQAIRVLAVVDIDLHFPDQVPAKCVLAFVRYDCALQFLRDVQAEVIMVVKGLEVKALDSGSHNGDRFKA